MLLQGTVGNIIKSYLDVCKPGHDQATAALQLPEQPSLSEILLTSFPSINPLSAARLISLSCSLSELLTLSAEEQKQLAMKLSDIPANSLELFFQQATWGQAITGLMPAAPGQRLQQNALEYGQHHTHGNDRQEDQAVDRSASHMQPDDYTEAYQTTQSAGLASERHENMLGLHTRPRTSMPSATHAPGVGYCSNPFQSFQCQPKHQSSSRSHDTQQLPQGYAHGDRQHGRLSSMGPGQDSGAFEIEEIPVDYTDDCVYSSRAPAAINSHQHHHQQQQQQQHGINWKSYLPEEEGSGDTVMERSMHWQPAGQQPRFNDEHCHHAGAADEAPVQNLELDNMGDDDVPDVVIDDVVEGALLLYYSGTYSQS